MARDGRNFEKLIELLESIGLDKKAVITSPDFLIDKDTGGTREVDISIRSKIGTIPFLIILECRDRTAVQGAPWVEEVSGKMISVNADKAIMISSSGFSNPARLKAKKLGMELRTFNEISKNEVYSWFKAEYLTLTKRRYQLDGVSIDIYEDQNIEEEIKSKLNKYENLQALDNEFKLSTDSRIVNLNYIFWDSLGDRAKGLFDTFPTDEENKVPKQFTFNFTNRQNCYQLFVDDHDIDIKSITFKTHCWREIEKIPVSRLFNYQDSEKSTLYNGVEFKLEFSEEKRKIVIVESVNQSVELREITVNLIDEIK